MSDTPFLDELRRRKVYQTGGAYVVAALTAWGAVEVAADAFGWADRILQVVIIVSLAGLPLALAGAWLFEVSRESSGTPRPGGVRPSRALAIGVGAGVVAFFTLGGLIATAIDPEAVGEPLLTSRGGHFRVAVLYFEDRTESGSLESIAEALTLGVIDELRGAGIDVVSANGIEQFKGADVPLDSVAGVLKASGLVTGSIQQAGSVLEIRLRLVDGLTGAVLETEEVTTSAHEVLLLRDRVVVKVANLVRRGIGRTLDLRSQQAVAPSTDAWLALAVGDRLFRKALSAMEEGDTAAAAEPLDEAESESMRGLEHAPDWPDLWVLRSRIAYTKWPFASTTEELIEMMQRAVGFADQALRLNPDDAAALEIRGTAQYRSWLVQMGDEARWRVRQEGGEGALERQLAAAQADLERSVTLDTSRAFANSVLSHLYLQVGNWRGALLAAQRSYDQDPFLKVVNREGILWRAFVTSYDLDLRPEAKRACAEGSRQLPDNRRFVQCQLYILTMNGVEPDIGEAWRLYDQLISMLPEGQAEQLSGAAETVLGGVIGKAGLPDSANAVMLRARRDQAVDPFGEQLMMEAAMRSIIGDTLGAIEALQRLLVLHPENRPDDHWWWKNLHGNPGFEALRRRDEGGPP